MCIRKKNHDKKAVIQLRKNLEFALFKFGNESIVKFD